MFFGGFFWGQGLKTWSQIIKIKIRFFFYFLFCFCFSRGTEKGGQSASDVTNTTVCVCVRANAQTHTRTHTFSDKHTNTHTHRFDCQRSVGVKSVERSCNVSAFSRAFTRYSNSSPRLYRDRGVHVFVRSFSSLRFPRLFYFREQHGRLSGAILRTNFTSQIIKQTKFFIHPVAWRASAELLAEFL